MAYTKTVWQDRAVEFPNRYDKSAETSASVTLVANPGVVTQAGTPINAGNMNNVEKALESMIGKDNTTIVETTSLKIATDTRSTAITYTSGQVTKEEVKDGATVMKTSTLGYDASGNVTTETIVANGKTITTTILYDGTGNVSGETRTIA